MRDLAPTITRQRLLLEGYYTIDVDEDVMRRFLNELPLWTTERFAALVLYTCKAFDANAAATFTRDFFAMTDSEYQQF